LEVVRGEGVEHGVVVVMVIRVREGVVVVVWPCLLGEGGGPGVVWEVVGKGVGWWVRGWRGWQESGAVGASWGSGMMVVVVKGGGCGGGGVMDGVVVVVVVCW
jgi:hypothetical protein